MALALTRKKEQAILFLKDGETIAKVTVVEIGHGHVKLRFEAPEDIRILREEVLDRSVE